MTQAVLLFLSLFALSAPSLAGSLVGITSDELQALQKKGAVVVDIRTPQEWAVTGVIPGSHELTFFDASGHYDKEAWLNSLKPLLGKKDQPVVLVCRSGNRSALVGKMMTSEVGFDRVYHLEKGIREWSAQSLPLTSGCATTTTCAASPVRPASAAP